MTMGPDPEFGAHLLLRGVWKVGRERLYTSERPNEASHPNPTRVGMYLSAHADALH